MRIAPSARRHGVTDDDIWHAVRNPMRLVDVDGSVVLVIAADGAGRMLEIGILDFDGVDPVVIHAMALRKRFHRFL